MFQSYILNDHTSRTADMTIKEKEISRKKTCNAQIFFTIIIINNNKAKVLFPSVSFNKNWFQSLTSIIYNALNSDKEIG